MSVPCILYSTCAHLMVSTVRNQTTTTSTPTATTATDASTFFTAIVYKMESLCIRTIADLECYVSQISGLHPCFGAIVLQFRLQTSRGRKVTFFYCGDMAAVSCFPCTRFSLQERGTPFSASCALLCVPMCAYVLSVPSPESIIQNYFIPCLHISFFKNTIFSVQYRGILTYLTYP